MQPGIVSFLLQHDWLKLISEILAALGDATFFSTVQDLQSWEIPLKSCGQQVSQPLPDGMLLALRTAQISDEDPSSHVLLARAPLWDGQDLPLPDREQARSARAMVSSQPTTQIKAEHSEWRSVVDGESRAPYGDPAGARKSQASSKCVGQ